MWRTSTRSRQFNSHQLLAARQLFVGWPSAQQTHAELTDTAADGFNAAWLQAKPYEEMPGPSISRTLSYFLPGGKLYNTNLIEMNRRMRNIYGDIYSMPAMMGKPNFVFTYNPKDFEITYRNEGIWPIRIGLESFTYYRKIHRPDIFDGVGGLVSEQGKSWADIRNKVNPVLMKVQNVRQNLPQIDQISQEFIDKLETIRDTQSHAVNDFYELLKMWAFEAISFVALNTRMGLFTAQPDPNAARLAQHMTEFFDYSFKYDVQPSIWPYYKTRGFKRFLQTYDSITEITTNYIDKAIQKFEPTNSVNQTKCVLEQLLSLNKQVAVVMAMDMLMAGIDTTSSAFITVFYHLGRNPAKQAKLQQELLRILPDAKAPLTAENTKSMPYLRACIKEGLRITSITPGNFRLTTKDLVLSGYRVPRGTGVIMNVLALSNSEPYFPHCDDFMPERWLKAGADACPAARSRNPFVYLPFGFGPRTCIGKRIAELEIETLLVRLLRRYQISWLGEGALQYASSIILTPHGDIRFKFEPRPETAAGKVI